MSKRILLLVFALLSNNILLNAQIGIIKDKESNSISYATVQLLSLPDSIFVAGTISDKDGKFDLKSNYPFDQFCIKISFIGYHTKVISPVKADMGIITLQIDDNLLKSVIVKGHKPNYKLDGGNVIMSVKNSFLSKLGRVSDVMRYLPGVWAPPGATVPSVLGKGTPKVYINGRLVRDVSELKQLHSSEIDQIELDTNPGPEYSSATEAVIRIKTLPKRGEGLSGYVDLYGEVAKKGYTYDEISLTYRRKGWDVFGGFGYIYGYGNGAISSATNDIRVFTDPMWQTVTSVDRSSKSNNNEGKFGFNYQPSKDHTMGILYRYYSNHPKLTQNSSTDYFQSNELMDRINSNEYSTNDDIRHLLNGYYTGRLSEKMKTEFTCDALWDNRKKIQDNKEQSLSSNSRTVHINSVDDNRLLSAKLIFQYNISHHQLRFGGAYNDVKRDNDYYNSLDEIENSAVCTQEKKGAAFLDYRLVLGKVTFKAGLRYEHTATDYYENNVQQLERSRTYDNFLPSTSISFPVGGASMSLAYSRTMKRPSFSRLSGNIYYHDPFTLGAGNPLLRPTLNQNISWRTFYKWVNLTITYRHTRDAIGTIRRLYGDNLSMTINRSENLPETQSLNLNTSIAPAIGCWRPMFTLSYTQPFFRFETPKGMQHFNRPLFQFMWNNTIELPAKFTVSCAVFYISNGNIDNNVWRKYTWSSSIQITKKLLKEQLEIYGALIDPFNQDKFNYTRYNPINIQNGYNKAYTRRVWFGVTYFFNYTKDSYKGKAASSDDINRLN